MIRTAAAAGLVALGGAGTVPGAEQPPLSSCPIAVFSKIYQELKLTYEQAAELTSEAGLDGIDCPVRAGGEVLPERVQEDLPRYADALAKHNRKIYLLTTGITSMASPHTKDVLRAAKQLGIEYYRFGFFNLDKRVPFEKQAAEIRSDLQQLAALNKDLGICGLFQNHTGSLGADLSQLAQVVEGFDPAHLGVAFDIGHALVVHRDEWRPHFEKLKPHIKVVYVKDARKGGGWVPFGQGDISGTNYFRLLKEMGYHAPISLHIEFDWSDKGQAKTRERMLQALRESNGVLKRWLAEA